MTLESVTICICREALSFSPSCEARDSNCRPAFAKNSWMRRELCDDWSCSNVGSADNSRDNVSRTGSVGGKNVNVEKVLDQYTGAVRRLLFAERT